jgi:hypothetical protein
MLLLASAALIGLIGAAHARDYPTAICGPATVAPAEYDSNPVVQTEVAYNPETHVWSILHHLNDGSIVSRAQQYGIVDSSNGNVARWEGDLIRNQTLHMVGTIDRNGHYIERIYNKTLRQWVTRIDSDCTMQRAAATAPIPQGTVLQGYPPAPQAPAATYYAQPVPAPVPPAPTYPQPAPAAGGNTIIVIPR